VCSYAVGAEAVCVRASPVPAMLAVLAVPALSLHCGAYCDNGTLNEGLSTHCCAASHG